MTAGATRGPTAMTGHLLAAQIIRREVITGDVVSLFLATPGTRRAPAPALPGQFVTLALPTATGTIYRSYSLCGSGSPHEPWELTIKRVRGGPVSNYLHDLVQVGMVLYSTPPRGAFVLPQPVRPDVPLIFVAAGSGITPIRGMIRALATLPAGRRPRTQLHYASRRPEDVIYLKDWHTIDPPRHWLTQWHYLTESGNAMTVEKLIRHAGNDATQAHWYVCGPDVLRRDLAAALAQRGVPADRVHAEVFASPVAPTGARATGPVAARVFVQATRATLGARRGETLLETLEHHGYRPDFSCRAGSCGTCRVRILAGRVDQGAASALSAAERDAGYALSCVARPLGDVAIESGGRPPAGVTAVAGGLGRGAARAAMRVALAGATIALVATVWPLTNHKPVSAASGAAPSSTKPVQPAATPTIRLNGGNPPTGGDDGGGGATATPNPAPSQPTPPIYQPPPQPTAVTSQS